MMRNVLPINTMAIAHGPAHPLRQRGHPVGPARARRCTSVEQSSSWSASPASWAARSPPARKPATSTSIGEYYGSADETLAKLGYAPNRKPGQRGFTLHA